MKTVRFSYGKLADAYSSSDEALLRQLYLPCHHDLMLYCLGKFKDAALAEDAASETLHQLLEHPDPSAIPNLKAWLLTVAKNACLKVITTRQRRTGILARIRDRFDGLQMAEGESKLQEESLHRACKRILGNRDYQIFIAQQQGYNDMEIATQLGISAKTVANRKSMIKKELQEKLRNYQ